MKAKTSEVRRRGRPRGELRNWFADNLPKIKLASTAKDAVKEVDVFVPSLDSVVTMEIPKGFHPIPAELTEGKTQATVGQTARNEVKNLDIKDKRFIVHEIQSVVEEGRGKNKKELPFSIFALEPTEV